MNDDIFEARLRRITSAADARPDHVLEAARAALTMRAIDAELATLVADSALADSGALSRRVVSDVRMLSFECGDVTVELDVTSHPDATVDLRGLAVGATGVVAVVRAGGRTEVPLDEDGRFLVTNAGSGPVRLELTTPSGGRVTTSWVTV